jgi:hypothetical protein
METSDSYIVIEKMIRRSEVSKSELEHLLNSLAEQRQITATEHQALLELAEELSRDKATP